MSWNHAGWMNSAMKHTLPLPIPHVSLCLFSGCTDLCGALGHMGLWAETRAVGELWQRVREYPWVRPPAAHHPSLRCSPEVNAMGNVNWEQEAHFLSTLSARHWTVFFSGSSVSSLLNPFSRGLAAAFRAFVPLNHLYSELLVLSPSSSPCPGSIWLVPDGPVFLPLSGLWPLFLRHNCLGKGCRDWGTDSEAFMSSLGSGLPWFLKLQHSGVGGCVNVHSPKVATHGPLLTGLRMTNCDYFGFGSFRSFEGKVRS